MLLALTLGLGVFQEASLAQTGTLGHRSEFVFHVYTDPLGGCDVLAAQLNPVGITDPSIQVPNTNLALSKHPHYQSYSNPPFDPGRIQQAPYAFRTLTKALEYVRTNFYTPDLNHNPNRYFLPWLLGPESDYQIHHIVIHCFPGIYAPIREGETPPAIDPKSGLPYNGESFPLGRHGDPNTPWQGIPPGVSIQGASALDVIFDGRGIEGEDPQLGYLRSGPGLQFGPYDGPWRTTYSVDAWGQGDLGGIDQLLDDDAYDWTGMRFNCQRGAFQPYPAPLSNLQTFLVVNGAILDPLTREPRLPLPMATQADLDHDLRRAKKFRDARR